VTKGCVMLQLVSEPNKPGMIVKWLFLAGCLVTVAGCGAFPRSEAEAQQPRQGQQNAGPAAVDVAIARERALQDELEYTGTTRPFREISLRSQAEGLLLDLNVDVGDSITQGQALARLDDEVLTSNVAEAQAEVAALEAEVASTRSEVSDARTQVEEARLQLQQAQSDLERQEQLFKEGAIAEREVELARTEVGTARQALRSTQEQVRTRQQAVSAAQRRVAAQQAVVNREQERQSYSVITSPVTGSVLERVTEPGNLVQPGSEILKLGDFSQVKVIVQVSELELAGIRTGQPVQVRLDAFPNRQFNGRVARISPAADPTARLIPVEVAIPNPGGRIGSGLLARVSFSRSTGNRIVVPETALEANQDRRARRGAGGGAGNNTQGQGQGQNGGDRSQSQPQSQNSGNAAQSGAASGETPRSRQSQSSQGTVFVVAGAGNDAKVSARRVKLGRRSDGLVEVLSGLEKGERFVVRTSKALKDQDAVRLSIISEASKSES
jgi:HlyD family secretion protein